MTALVARYHNQCLTALANTNTNAKYEFNKEEAKGGIVMGEFIIYIIWERDQTDTNVNSTKIKERLIKMCQQAVLMNPFAFTNMIMHRTTIDHAQDNNSHGYHWVLLFNLMVLRN